MDTKTSKQYPGAIKNINRWTKIAHWYEDRKL